MNVYFKIILGFLILITIHTFSSITFAQTNSFVNIVNPIRGSDFWELKDQMPKDAVLGQLEILNNLNLPATWLIRVDALSDQEIINPLKNRNDEKGLFLEITPSWTNLAGVSYNQSQSWHFAQSIFLTGYNLVDREKLIDSAFAKFKDTFGSYPQSVGAWWIDSYSLNYMQEKYEITSALIVADQYSTDHYQIWGQYFSTPYYPSKLHTLYPAKNKETKLDLVIIQWAARDPFNGYGKGVEDSTYSVQVNDYIDYHDLGVNYFEKLVDIYTKNNLNKFGHLVVGLENSYQWQKYKQEYQKQLQVLKNKQQNGQLSVVKMSDFSNWYRNQFPDVSPEHLIVADDPLGSEKKVVWYMNQYYRIGWFYDGKESYIADLRQYVDGEEELCREQVCSELNFATFATRVLDNVTYGHKWLIDQGKIQDFKISRENEKIILNYINASGVSKKIELLPRDVAVEGKIYTIDRAILESTKVNNIEKQNLNQKIVENNQIAIQWLLLAGNFLKFIIFLILVIFIPGFMVVKKFELSDDKGFVRIFLSLVLGIVQLTLVSFVFGLLKLWEGVYIYSGLVFLLFLVTKSYKHLPSLNFKKVDLIALFLILAGVIFQSLPVVKSGLEFSYGLGFWGPNTHDGIWHLSLVNQITKGIPVENPIFSGEILKNYHYFYDLLIAITQIIINVNASDLIFRFYPIIFSLLLGVGAYYLIKKFTTSSVATYIALYLTYFGSSFGWIVEYLRNKSLGGESAFWANQPVSFNLNPPFAISLILVIALILIFFSIQNKKNKLSLLVILLLISSFIGFKAYASILVLGSLAIVGIYELIKHKNRSFLGLFIGSSLFSLLWILPTYQFDQQTTSSLIGIFIFSPFWFIHSMIDSSDRVGWVRLSLARISGIETNQWGKFLLAEGLGLLLFFVGNLGIRIFGLGVIIKMGKLVLKPTYLFIITFCLLSLLIPILFIQVGTPWNTIQFFYYFLFISSIFTGVSLIYLYKILPKSLVTLIIAFLLVLAPISSISTAWGYLYPFPHAFISKEEVEGLNFLSSQPDGVVLTIPFDKDKKREFVEPLPLLVYETTAYVSALSKKPTFLEDEIQQSILGKDYLERRSKSNGFFKDRTDNFSTNFLIQNKIAYIYMPKIFNKQLNENDLPLKKIYENAEVIIYQIIQ